MRTIQIQIGDLVKRKSYGGDICFRVDDIVRDQGKDYAILRGQAYRLCADAPLDDLEIISQLEVNKLHKDNLKIQRQQLAQVASQRAAASRVY